MAMGDPMVQPWQIAPRRDILTGELLRDETPKIRLRTLDADRPDPVVEHDRYPFRQYQPRTRQREMLPDLSELLDDEPGKGDADV